MRKVSVVDRDLCIGCGYWNEVCPEVFERENKKSQVIGPGKFRTCNCQEAIDTCPVQAISWGKE